MAIPFFDLTRLHHSIEAELSTAISRVIGKGQFILGEEVRLFEKRFADYLGVKHCITCANGTDALELALDVCGIGSGDEVIVPAFGWISPALATQKAGAIPIFSDVEWPSGNIDPAQIRGLITSKTKGIIPIHLFGNPCAIDEIKKICQEHSLYLIEDCAQAHGATVNGRKTGSIGDISVFSFYPTKNIGCLGDGGALVTDRDDLAERLRALRDYGRVSRSEFRYVGRNSRMDELQAAVLNVKLNYLDTWNAQRRAIAKRYWSSAGRGASDFPARSVFYQFQLPVKDRLTFRQKLEKAGVGTDVYPVYIAHHLRALVPVTNQLSEMLISLPVYPNLTESEITYICEQLVSLEDQIL